MVSLSPSSSTGSLVSNVSYSWAYTERPKSTSDLDQNISNANPRGQRQKSISSSPCIHTCTIDKLEGREDRFDTMQGKNMIATLTVPILLFSSNIDGSSETLASVSATQWQERDVQNGSAQSTLKWSSFSWLNCLSIFRVTHFIDYILELAISFLSRLAERYPVLIGWTLIRALVEEQNSVDGCLPYSPYPTKSTQSTNLIMSITPNPEPSRGKIVKPFSKSRTTLSLHLTGYHEETEQFQDTEQFQRDLVSAQSEELLSPDIIVRDGSCHDTHGDWGHFAFYKEEDEGEEPPLFEPFNTLRDTFSRKSSMPQTLNKLDVVEEDCDEDDS